MWSSNVESEEVSQGWIQDLNLGSSVPESLWDGHQGIFLVVEYQSIQKERSLIAGGHGFGETQALRGPCLALCEECGAPLGPCGCRSNSSLSGRGRAWVRLRVGSWCGEWIILDLLFLVLINSGGKGLWEIQWALGSGRKE